MRADINFLSESFDRFNRECFGGVLPRVRLRISSSVRSLGSLRHPRVMTPSTRPESITLSVSNRLDHPRELMEDTVIHEMIHLYILWMRVPDTSAHGPAFRRMMSAINLRHGRNVTVSHRSVPGEHATDRIVKERLVLITDFDDGIRAVTVCSPVYVGVILGSLPRVHGVKQWRMIRTSDSRFASYRESRTLKFYQPPREGLDDLLADGD